VRLCFLSDARAEHTRRWTRFFALRGHSTHLITWNSTHLDGYSPVQLHVLEKPLKGAWGGARILNLVSLYRSARALIQNIQPDVVHAHSMGSYSWLAWAMAHHPYVVSPWGTDILVDAVRSRGNRWLTRLSAQGSDLILCDGRHIKDRLVEMGIPCEKIELVPFGTDVNVFSPAPADDPTVPLVPSWGDSPIVVSTRTLTPIHDVKTFVQSIPYVLKRFPEARFAIVGGGDERPALEKMAKALGVIKLVHFVGHVGEEDLRRWLRGASVYVSSSLMDAGLAGSTAEAMACGLPVVTTDNADNALWVKEGEGGYLVPNGDPVRMAERVECLLRDSDLRSRFGQFNRQVIVEKNNTSREMSRVESLYELLFRRKQQGAVR
jgi:glycosyltransferase involved in cell wall biosynthesis